jgi:malonyl-ACP decarboxylase
MDLSYWECQSLRALGAMGSDRYAGEPALACRPFDCDHDGFIFGESCGAVVIESLESSERRGVEPYAALRGWGVAMDGNRNPEPSLEGETRAIHSALDAAGLTPAQIDYVSQSARHGFCHRRRNGTEGARRMRTDGRLSERHQVPYRSWLKRRRYG